MNRVPLKKIKHLSENRPWVLDAFKTYVLTRENFVSKTIKITLNFLYFLHQRQKSKPFQSEKISDVESIASTTKVKAIGVPYEAFNKLVPQEKSFSSSSSVTDIIIPVYKGYEETSRCLFSVLRAKNTSPFELIVINDKSPDQKIQNLLHKLAQKDLITLLDNSENLGFVGSTNKGMSFHNDRNVIWLNSDTEVFDNWIDRILEIARTNPKIATLTAITNNSTISSYPKTLADNNQPLEISDRDLDKLCSTLNLENYVEAPTGVGCCMFVSRTALAKCGDLDIRNFGKGYGEENDLCQRFEKAGFINVITPKVFVRHYGSISFGTEATKLQKENLLKLIDKHPNYLVDVQQWVQADPLLNSRVRLDAARLKLKYGKIVLHISHRKGGGTAKFVYDLSSSLKKENVWSLNLFPSYNDNIELDGNIDFNGFPNIKSFNLKYDRDCFKDFLIFSGVQAIHIHSLIDFPLSFLNAIIDLPEETRPELIVSIHDYHWICPRIDLMPTKKSFCNTPTQRNCGLCSKVYCSESPFLQKDYFQRILNKADRRIVPSADSRLRLEAFYKDLSFEVIPHQNFQLEELKEAHSYLKTEALNVAILGAIGLNKGYEVIEKIAKYLQINKLENIKLFVIGYSLDDDKLKSLGVEVSGAYTSETFVQEYVREKNISLIFLPSITPETYSYTFSEAEKLGLPIICFNIGAQYERLSNLNQGTMALPYSERFNPSFLVPEILNKVNNFSPYSVREDPILPDRYYDFLRNSVKKSDNLNSEKNMT